MRSHAMPVAFALLITAFPLAAQQVNIAAAVPVAAPVGSGVRNLTFGAIIPVMGQVLDVDVVAAAAPLNGTVQSGEFRFDVTGSSGLEFLMTMPAALTSGILPPLAVSWSGGQYGGYCVTSGGTSCVLTNFDPSASLVRVCQQTRPNGTCHPGRVFPPASELGIFIGGRLSVPPTARAAVYSGTITLTIVQVY
ncbi:MAG: hypothetical protein ACREK1_00365 [Longimicrobiales bacterium]